MKNLVYTLLTKKTEWVVVFFSTVVSLTSFWFFYTHGQQNLGNFDALSRLNIARKIIDNQTPGLGQFGSVWLPLPQFLMLPFIWNEFLWHSGIAGAIASMICFILSILYLYKILVILFNSYWVRIIGIILYVFNINLLLLQTMAMSESIYLFFLLGATYYLMHWTQKRSLMSLIISAVFIAGGTLTRYEGYFLLIFAAGVVFIITYLQFYHKKGSVEGLNILFLTLSSFGVIIWFIYLAAIFQDPFYSFNIYTHNKTVLSENVKTITPIASDTVKLTFGEAFIKTWWSTALMNGIIPTVIAVFGLILYSIKLIRENEYFKLYYLPLLLLLSPFVFVVVAVYRQTIPLNLPLWDIADIFNKGINLSEEYNIRYGIQLLPAIAVFCAWALNGNLFKKSFLTYFLLLQVISLQTPLYLIYDLSVRWKDSNQIGHYEDNALLWLSRNYDGGYIMISAFKHDPTMFRLGLSYNRYIHEGSGKYWLESIKHPSKYVTWVYMQNPESISQNAEGDPVSRKVSTSSDFKQNYNLVFKDSFISIYKIKDTAKSNLVRL